MIYIGLLSDTHGYLNPSVLKFLDPCDELWHAGDIGNLETLRQLQKFKPIKAVSGNIDPPELRFECPEVEVFFAEKMKVVMVHIGGYPGRYSSAARHLIMKEKPALFVCGHSHILRVVFDAKYQHLVLNPGAAGKTGFHRQTTALRFRIDSDQISQMEIFDQNRI